MTPLIAMAGRALLPRLAAYVPMLAQTAVRDGFAGGALGPSVMGTEFPEADLERFDAAAKAKASANTPSPGQLIHNALGLPDLSSQAGDAVRKLVGATGPVRGAGPATQMVAQANSAGAPIPGSQPVLPPNFQAPQQAPAAPQASPAPQPGPPMQLSQFTQPGPSAPPQDAGGATPGFFMRNAMSQRDPDTGAYLNPERGSQMGPSPFAGLFG